MKSSALIESLSALIMSRNRLLDIRVRSLAHCGSGAPRAAGSAIGTGCPSDSEKLSEWASWNWAFSSRDGADRD